MSHSKCPGPVTKESIEKYAAYGPDFIFELKVLSVLRALKINCVHTGVYEDPTQQKCREFDIRAEVPGTGTIHLAIECKNITPTSALVVNCVRRQEDEAFHEILVNAGQPVTNGRSYIDKIRGENSLYSTGQWVGKALSQVDENGKELRKPTENSGGCFDRYNQAVQSAAGLVDRAREIGNQGATRHRHFILPVLVIPDEVLWVLKYGADGTLIEEPGLANHISYKLNRHISSGYVDRRSSAFTDFISYCISHLEIVTVGYLPDFFQKYLRIGSQEASIFEA